MTAFRATIKRHGAPWFRPAPKPGPAPRAFGWLATDVTQVWLLALLATIISILAYTWYASRGLTFGYADALSRIMIARRVVVSRTPGLAQLGTTWPTLNSIAMLPLIWDNTLFHNGFAGSFPSMVAYVITSLYLFRTVRLLMNRRVCAWAAALIFMLNPSVAYLQSTAMSEIPMVCAATVSVYYMVRWARSYYALDLVKSAAAVAAGTGIRYDGWALAAAFALLVFVLAWRRQGFQGAQSWGILYGLLGFSGCAAWTIYNTVIFHDPLLFLYFGNANHSTSYMSHFPQYHHAWMSFEMFGYSAAGMVGWATAALAIAGLAAFAMRHRLQHGTLPIYALLTPLAYHWLVFYLGFDTILLPQLGLHIYWNARFGIELIPALAFFVGYLAGLGRVPAVITFGVLAWFAVTYSTSQIPFALREPLATQHGITAKMEADWLINHYHGGNVLISYIPSAPAMFYMMQRIPDLNFITDANGAQFRFALSHPQLSVRWVVMEQNDSSNRIWTGLHNRQVLKRYFVLRGQLGTTMFYERIRPQGRGGRPGHRGNGPLSGPQPSRGQAPAGSAPGPRARPPGNSVFMARVARPWVMLPATTAKCAIPRPWQARYSGRTAGAMGHNARRIRASQLLAMP